MTPSEPIDVARAINDAFAATPFEVLREVAATTSGLPEARERLAALGRSRAAEIVDLLDEEIVVGETDIEGASVFASDVARGWDAWWRWFTAWFEPWIELEVEALAYEAIGEEVVLSDCHVTARGEISGAPVELDLTQLWAVRGGKVVRYGIYSSHEAAARAAERPPQGVT